MRNNMPWMFHIPDKTVADLIAAHIYELGGVVIADPAHLGDDLTKAYLHTVGTPDDDGGLPITIHAVDWTTTVNWEPDEPEYTARDVYTMADGPTEFYESAESLPEGTPKRVAVWLDFEDED